MATIFGERITSSLKEINPASLARLSDSLQKLVESRLWLRVVIALLLGVLLGLALGPDLGWVEADKANLIAGWLAFPGHLFLALIQMIVVPLVLASVIRGLASASSITQLKLLGIYGSVFFICMTAISAVVGIGLANVIVPGSYVDPVAIQTIVKESGAGQDSIPMDFSLADLPHYVVGLIPNNPLQAFSAGDMLRIVVFSVVFGVALMSLPTEKSSPLYALLESLQEVCMTIVGWAMKLAPIAVFGLVTKLTSTVGISVLVGILVYIATVLGGLLVIALLYLLLILVVGKHAPIKFLKDTKEVLLLAFSTSSSAAVMPMTIKTLEEKFSLNNATIRFLIPLGATVNMSGTALYQGVATVFLAQIFGVNLDPTAMLLVVMMIVFASIGSPATPGASIIILSMMLGNLNIPAAGIALILGADRILDMCRTMVNVLGDISASIVVDRIVGSKLELQQAPA